MGNRDGRPVLREEDCLAFCASSGLSKEEIEEKFQIFLKDHPSGQIDRRSFRKILCDVFPVSNNPVQDVDKIEKHMFRLFDTNEDDHIDFVEFMVVFHVLRGILKYLFRLIYINADCQGK